MGIAFWHELAFMDKIPGIERISGCGGVGMVRRVGCRESEVLMGVRGVLDAYGVVYVRLNAGRVRTYSGSYVRLAGAGWPDLVGCLPKRFGAYAGHFLGVEVKARGEVPRDEQVLMLLELQAAGGVVFWVDDVAQAHAIMGRLERGIRPWMNRDGTMGERCDESTGVDV